ncbi:MAG TPA: phosphatase PAP2 family protein, partial [Capillimicrobium sp.]|nr:phosphatase PAP2 family protein [Capillimicrobium sp.]
AERPVLRPVARVVRPIVWHGIVPAAGRLEGPARFAWNRLTPGELGLEVTTLVAIAAVGSFGFLALALSVGPGEPLPFSDQRAYEIADDLHTAWLIDAAKMVTYLGSLVVVAPLVIVAAGILVAWRRWAASLALVAATAILVVSVHVAKAVVDRPRPSGSLVETAGSAYPSAHAAYAIAWIAVAVVLWRFVPWLAGRAFLVTVAIAIALAVGVTRIYLHAQWWSDVVGGAGLAATVYAVCGVVGMLVTHVRHNRVSA